MQRRAKVGKVQAERVARRRAGRHAMAFAALLAGSTTFAALIAAARAQDLPLVRNDFGSVGLIDMPSARMAPDGELSMGADFTKNTQHYNFGFQVTPWLETSFRYTGLDHFDPAYSVYYDRSFEAKLRLWNEGDWRPAVAVGINDLIGTGIYNGEYLVASKQFGAVDATLGMGWGRLGSTALFANPVAQIFPSFKNRSGFDTPGGAHFNTFFHGPDVGLFGGLAWATPVDGLSLIAEYSSDRYTVETQRGTFKARNQFNFGASYQLTDTVNVGLDWLYGESLSGHFTIAMDPVHDPFPQRLGPTPPAPQIRTVQQQQQAVVQMLNQRRNGSTATASSQMVDALWRANGGLTDIVLRGRVLSLDITQGDPGVTCRNAAQAAGHYGMDIDAVTVSNGRRQARCAMPSPALFQARTDTDGSTGTGSADITPAGSVIDAREAVTASPAFAAAKIRADAKKQQILIEALDLSGGTATIYYANTQYFSEMDALNRLVGILTEDAPSQIEKFRLIATLGGVPQREFDILRGPIERSYSQTGDIDLATNMTAFSPPLHNPILAAAARGSYPRFDWFVFPQFRQELFDPSNPFAVQFLAGAEAVVELLPGLSITGEAEASIWDNFNVNRPSDSVLPHVRTDFIKYFTEGKNGIGQLEAGYQFRLAPNVFAIARAGYLESMFAGVGGEVLWRPEGERWAIGVDGYEVQQRDFDRLFGLQPYKTFTGHVSLYYSSPWYNLNFILRAGQYLAGDRGLTLEVTRRFATGVEIGAFVTKTNVSAQQFGEGSFDKGISIRIPIGWTLPVNTQTELNTEIRPVQRDGGQRLGGDALLYEDTWRTNDETNNTAYEW